ncbi:MAG: M50 family metallopeptidase [Bacteroidota bacterium]|nr:M50 family metallopeptidase [Bacteroidota bacterium]
MISDPKLQFFLLLTISFIIVRIPYIGKIFKVVNTMIHESGHAFAALLTSGEVLGIELFSNSEGVTLTKSKSFFSSFITSLAGYVFSSLCAFFSFYLIKKGHEQYIFYFFLSIALINIILWVRNIYGIIWLMVFGGLIYYIYVYSNDEIKNITSIILSGILLTESIFSTIIIIIKSFTDPKSSGDAANLQKETHIPAFIWAIFFLCQAIYLGYRIVLMYI